MQKLKEEVKREQEKRDEIHKEIADIRLGELWVEVEKTKKEGAEVSQKLFSAEARLGIAFEEQKIVESRKETLEKEIAILSLQKKELDAICAGYAQAETALGESEERVYEMTAREQSLLNILAELETRRATLQTENAALAKRNADTQNDFAEREGKISKDGQRLTRYERRLRVLQQELEAYYNRKFPYVGPE